MFETSDFRYGGEMVMDYDDWKGMSPEDDKYKMNKHDPDELPWYEEDRYMERNYETEL